MLKGKKITKLTASGLEKKLACGDCIHDPCLELRGYAGRIKRPDISVLNMLVLGSQDISESGDELEY